MIEISQDASLKMLNAPFMKVFAAIILISAASLPQYIIRHRKRRDERPIKAVV